MKAYAIAHMREVDFGPQIVDYLENIDETLEPFGGRYVIHGGAKTVLEGEWPGDLVMIEFPDVTRAKAWYASPAYQSIVALRTDNSTGNVVIVEGAKPGHRGADLLG